MAPAFELPDHVDFDNLVEVRFQGERFIEANSAPEFDLGGLANASSATVAILVAWFRYAHVRGKVVTFNRIPAGIMNIIELTELNKVLPLAGSAGTGRSVGESGSS